MRSRSLYLLLLVVLFMEKRRVRADDTDTNLDVVFLIDTSLSFEEDLPRFQAVVANIVQRTDGLSPDTRYGLAHFSDYNTPQYGRPEDTDYTRDTDLTDDGDAFVAEALTLVLLHGNDEAESSLRAVNRAVNATETTIRMNFRDDARKVVVLWTDAKFHSKETTIPKYPGPTFATVISNLRDSSVDPPYVFVGLNRDGEERNTGLATPDLQRLANATNAFAEQPVPCGAGGGGTLATGAALVCTKVGGSEEAIEEGFVNIIAAGAGAQPVVVTPVDPANCDDVNGLVEPVCSFWLPILPDFVFRVLLAFLSLFP